MNSFRKITAPTLLFVLLAPLGLWLVVGAAQQLLALVNYSYSMDGLEGTLLYEARLLRAGMALYQPLAPDRFVSAPYPPVSYALFSLADTLPGPHIFWGGRLVSLLAALGATACAALLVRRATGSWLAGLLSAALLLAAPPLILWGSRIKPDALALFWTALGLLLATNDQRPTTNMSRLPSTVHRPLRLQLSIVAAALCFALAFYTKQTAVAAPLAVGLALLSSDLLQRTKHLTLNPPPATRHPQLLPLNAQFFNRLSPQTGWFTLSYLLLVGVAWLALEGWSGGQFSFHTVTMHRRALWTPQLMGKFVGLLAPYWPATILALLLPLHALRHPPARVVAWYALLAPLTLLGAGKTGANHNHLLETILALSLAAGVAAGWGLRLLARRQWFGLLLPGLLAVQLVLALNPPEWYAGELTPTDPPERFVALVRSMPGEVLADDASILLQAGKPLRYDDHSGIGPVAFSGLWDQRGLVEAISQRRFSAILIPTDVRKSLNDPTRRWTPEMLAAIREHYQVLYNDRIVTYVPK